MYPRVNFLQTMLRDPNGGPGGQQQQTPPAGQQGTQVPGQQQQTPPADQKPKKPLDAFSALWQTKKPAPTGGDNGTQTPPNIQQFQQQQQPPEDKLGNYLKDKDYFKGSDAAKLQTAFESRNFGEFQTELGGIFRNFHRDVLKEAARMGEAFRDEAVTTATQKTGETISSREMDNMLFSKHPELKDPALAPVARGVFQRLVADGREPEAAMQGTFDYFVAVGTTFNKAPPNSNGPRGKNQQQQEQDDTPPFNFDEILGTPA